MVWVDFALLGGVRYQKFSRDMGVFFRGGWTVYAGE